MKHIRTLNKGNIKEKTENNRCEKCQASCQSACRTSCTSSNQKCENSK